MTSLPASLVEQLQPLRARLHAGPNAVLPVVGSGLSRGLLSWTDLLKKLVALVDPPDARAELLRELERDKYLEVARELERVLGRTRVSMAIRDAYQRPTSPPRPANYDRVASLPVTHFATTNYDPWLKDAVGVRLAQMPRVYTPEDPGAFEDLSPGSPPLVLMLHGDADRPGTCVLTEADFRHLSHFPKYRHALSALVSMRSLLFIGHSLTDPDLRLVLDEWQELLGAGGAPRHWFLGVGLSSRVQHQLLERGVMPVEYGKEGDYSLLVPVLEYLATPPGGPTGATPARGGPVPSSQSPGLGGAGTPPSSPAAGALSTSAITELASKLNSAYPQLASALRRLVDLIRHDRARPALQSIRVATEMALKSLCIARGLKPPPGATSHQIEELLYAESAVPPDVQRNLEALRDHGNTTASFQPIGSETLALATLAFERFLYWYAETLLDAETSVATPPSREFVITYLEHATAMLKALNEAGVRNAFVPTTAVEVGRAPDPPDGTPDEPPLVRVRQFIRMMVEQARGGEPTTAQLATISGATRRVRNVVRVLKKAQEPVVLLGEPGAGKSMTLREVGVTLAQQERRRDLPGLVVYVRLGQYTSRDMQPRFVGTDLVEQWLPGDVMDLVRGGIPPEFVPLRAHLATFAEEGRLTVLFDGMDEMPRSLYLERIAALSEFAQEHRGRVKTLFACRINDFSPGFRHRVLVLAPFTRSQVLEFVRKNVGSTIDLEGKRMGAGRFVDRLAEAPALVDLVENPFLLFLICRYVRTRKSLPRSRNDLFGAYVEDSLARAYRTVSQREHRAPEIPAAELLHVLSSLAFAIMRQDGAVYGSADTLEESLGPTTRAAIALGRVSELLAVDPGEDDRVRFCHHRIQEYMTALHVARGGEALAWAPLLDTPRWQETIVCLAALAPSSPALRTLVEQLEGAPPLPYDDPEVERLVADRIVLASEVLRNAGAVAGIEPLRGVFERAVVDLARGGRPTSQVKAIWACKNVPDVPLGDVLAAPRQSDVEWVREQALQVLASPDAARRAVGTNLAYEMALDTAAGRIFGKLPVYWRIAWRQRSVRWIAVTLWTTLWVLVDLLLLGAWATLVWFNLGGVEVYKRSWMFGVYAACVAGASWISYRRRWSIAPRTMLTWLTALGAGWVMAWTERSLLLGLSGAGLALMAGTVVNTASAYLRTGMVAIGPLPLQGSRGVSVEAWRISKGAWQLAAAGAVLAILVGFTHFFESGARKKTEVAQSLPVDISTALSGVTPLPPSRAATLDAQRTTERTILACVGVGILCAVVYFVGTQRRRARAIQRIADGLQDFESWCTIVITADAEAQAIFIEAAVRLGAVEGYDVALAELRGIEQSVTKEPALSAYWRTTHELEQSARQQRKEGLAA